jgi:hypothetical protein
MINKMLWATDGSKDSFEALKYAELLAKKLSSPQGNVQGHMAVSPRMGKWQ